MRLVFFFAEYSKCRDSEDVRAKAAGHYSRDAVRPFTGTQSDALVKYDFGSSEPEGIVSSSI